MGNNNYCWMAVPTEDYKAYCIAVAKLQEPYLIRGKKRYATLDAAKEAADDKNAALLMTEEDITRLQSKAYSYYLHRYLVSKLLNY